MGEGVGVSLVLEEDGGQTVELSAITEDTGYAVSKVYGKLRWGLKLAHHHLNPVNIFNCFV